MLGDLHYHHKGGLWDAVRNSVAAAQRPDGHRCFRAAHAPASHVAAAIGVSVGVGAVLVAAVLAALYAWHRLHAPVPLITWLTSGGKAPSSGGSGVRAGLSLMPRGPVCRLQVAPLPCMANRCTG